MNPKIILTLNEKITLVFGLGLLVLSGQLENLVFLTYGSQTTINSSKSIDYISFLMLILGAIFVIWPFLSVMLRNKDK